MTGLIAEFGSGQVLWSMIWFFCFFIWIWLLIMVFGDIFRSHDLGGGSKALWCIFVIILPYLGVFIYLIARGHKMQEHTMEQVQAQDAMQRQYIQSVTGSSSSSSAADEIARLADLKEKGVITEEEFQAGKAKVLAS
jgi:Short C-terminal domain/Phospholipase_D-nuclease N-terminal